jgi:hypothetical protein
MAFNNLFKIIMSHIFRSGLSMVKVDDIREKYFIKSIANFIFKKWDIIIMV